VTEPVVELHIKLPDGPTVVCSWRSWAEVPMDLRLRVAQELRWRVPHIDLNKILGPPR
jgi:hypothetical protein